MDTYIILDEQGGWMLNIILWDGNLATWQPPAGTRVVLAAQVDFSTLPERPE